MELPKFSNPIKDPVADVIYNVMAFRALSREEIVRAVQFFTSQRKGKKIKRGTTITIISTIGA